MALYANGYKVAPIVLGSYEFSNLSGSPYDNTALANALNSKLTDDDNVSRLNNDAGYITSSYHDTTKQDKLVSGTNIKTINGSSVLGSGNIATPKILIFNDLSISNWNYDYTYYDYPYYCDLYCPGVTQDMVADVYLDVTDALSGEFAPVSMTYTDTVRIYSKNGYSYSNIPTVKVAKA